MNPLKTSRLAGMVLAAGILLVGGTPAEAVSPYVQPCVDAYDDAPASAHCPRSSVGRVGASSDPTSVTGHCLVAVSSCSISVEVAGESTSFTPAWPTAFPGDGISLAATSTIDICFSGGEGTYTATVRAGCNADETDSATAVDNGLN